MNAVADIKAGDLIEVVNANPVMVLTDAETFDQFYEAMKRETDALEVDLSTDKGRKAIAAMAYKVARTKTAIDDAGKLLNEEARSRINAVDEARRRIRAQLDALRDEVRRPLTEWEAAEEARVARCNQAIARLHQAAIITLGATSADLRSLLTEIKAIAIGPDEFKDLESSATTARDNAVEALSAAIERLAKQEAEQAELERLRREAEEREAKEAAEREERERAERERLAAEEAERRRKEAEEAEARRIKEAEERAAQAARDEEARKAREAEEERERLHQEQLAEERRQREEAERRERERVEAEKREADAIAKREADQAHRSKILKAAKEAIMKEGGVDEPTAKSIVLAIAARNIPNVTISF